MNLHSPTRVTTLATALSTAALGIAASVATAGNAGAATPVGNAVVFGDSYYSSPASADRTGDCGQSDQNWPRLAAADTGSRVDDWSCSGATSGSMLDRIDAAAAAGALSPTTSSVFISVGGNDFSHQDAVRGNPVPDLDARRATVLGNVGAAVAKIRAAAPVTRIIFSSYLPATDGPTYCPQGTAGPAQSDPGLDSTEAYISDTMALAAGSNGSEFVDVRGAAKAQGNSTCSPVGQRFVTGFSDGGADHLFDWHPTQAGNRFMADQLEPRITALPF